MSRLRELRREAQVALPTSGEVYTAEDGTVSTVLDDTYDPSHEPSEQEVLDYAEWLGMEFPEDEELMWLAREGLKAPIPKEWKPCKTDGGEVYYFNFKTGESLWDHPLDEYFKEKFAKEKAKLKQKKIQEAADKRAQEEDARRAREREAAAEKQRAADEAAENKRRKQEAEELRARKAKEEQEAKEAAARKEAAAAEADRRRETAAAAATKRNNPSAVGSSSSSLPTAASPTFSQSTSLPTPTSAKADLSSTAKPAGSKLMSEADIKRQAAVKKDMETELQARLARAEDEFNKKLDTLAAAQRRSVESAKSAATLKQRQRVQEAEDQVQEQLEKKQADAEVKNKREIARLEEEIDDARARIKRLQREQADRISRGEADVDNDIDREVKKRIAAVDAEVLTERQRHEAKTKAAESAERLKLETEVDVAKNTAADKADSQYATTAAARKAAHEATLRKLREDAKVAIEQERERIRRANTGETAALVAELQARTRNEVAAIQSAGDEELEALRRSEQAAFDEQARVYAAQEVGAAGGADAAALDGRWEAELRPGIDADAAARHEDAKAANEAHWRAKLSALEQERARRLADARGGLAGPSGSGSIDLPALSTRLQTERRAAVDALKDDLHLELEAATRQADQGAASRVQEARALADAELQREFNKWVEGRQREQRAVEAKNRAASASLATQDAAEHQRLATALDKLKREWTDKLADDTRRVRAENDTAVAEAQRDLIEELTSLEQAKRRALESEFASPDQSVLSSAGPTQIFDDSELFASRLAELRAEYATAEARLRSQPFLSTTAPAPSAYNSVNRATRSTGAVGGFGNTIDARNPTIEAAHEYLQEQTRESETRHASLAAARNDWREASGSGGGLQQRRAQSAPRELYDQHNQHHHHHGDHHHHHQHHSHGHHGEGQHAASAELQPHVMAALQQLSHRVDALLHLKRGGSSPRHDAGYSTLEVESPYVPQRGGRGERRSASASKRRGEQQAGRGGAEPMEMDLPRPRPSSRTRQRSSTERRRSSSAQGRRPAGPTGGSSMRGHADGNESDQAKALAVRWQRVLHENAGHH
jgi:centrosomal protein CEP164